MEGNMEDRHLIDDLFREGLGHPDIPFDESAWIGLSHKLHRSGRPHRIRWIAIGAAAAIVAAVLLRIDWRKPSAGDNPLAANYPVVTDTIDRSDQLKAPIPPASPDPVAHHEPDRLDGRYATVPGAPVDTRTQGTRDGRAGTPRLVLQPVVMPRLQPTSIGPARASLPPAGIRSLPSVVSSSDPAEAPATPLHMHTVMPMHGWTWSILAAPDLSGTHLLNGKLSSNIGLLVSYRLNRRLSLGTGVLYARKLYDADFADYAAGTGYQIPRSPLSVAADCDVLDIPINLTVDLLQQGRSVWFASAGVSSYLMLKEKYRYRYPPHTYGAPRQTVLHHANRHLLGIGNLSVGYRRRVSPVVDLTVQPFVKVPLTGIGDGNLKLYSSGVALSADIDLSRRNSHPDRR